MKTMIAAFAMTIGVVAPAIAGDYGYGGDYGYDGVVVAPVVVAPVARIYVPPPPVYVAPVARVYAAPYYRVGYGGGWRHSWGHGGWGHGGWGHPHS